MPIMDQQEPVLLDVSRLVWRAWSGVMPTGIDRTCLAYLEHYRPSAQAVVQRGRFTRVLSPSASQRLFDILLSHDAGVSRGRLRMAALLQAFSGRKLPSVPGQFYLNVGHTGLDRCAHSAWLAQAGVHPIYFVHDLIPLTHPEFCRTGEADKHRLRMLSVLENGAGIISNSHDTLDQLSVFADAEKSSGTPSTLVAPLGVSFSTPEAGKIRKEKSSKPYFLVLGTIEARKNHFFLLTLWAELARRLGDACPQLVVIGRRGWESEQTVDMLERCAAIKAHVLELPRCNDADLHAYVKGAQALLFPSFIEGYGLPVIEALACGTPVIASHLPVFRELAGSIPDYLSPVDGIGWMTLIENYAQPHSERRTEQLRRMAGWSPPTWAAHFAQVDYWLEQLRVKHRSGRSSSD